MSKRPIFNRARRTSLSALVIVLATLTALAVGILAPRTALASPSSQIVAYRWNGPTKGVRTTVSVVAIRCASTSCNSDLSNPNPKFIDNEAWLYQNGRSDCLAGQCRIEAGYATRNYDSSKGAAQVWYFWEDLRPGSQAFVHWIKQVPSADYGHPLTIEIYAASCCSVFYVNLYAYTSTMTNQSTGNTMNPNSIEIGSELSGGASSQSAPYAYFNNNQWYDGSRVAHYQTSNGSGIVNEGAPPPYMGASPIPQYSSTGGTIYTHCC